MWIVDIAIRRPYTFIVMALLIVLAAPLALSRMPADILPEINIPVISVVWSYEGLSAQEMGARIAAGNERGLTTTVSDIEHIESQSLAGVSVIKVFFHQNANIQTALAQVVAMTQYQLKQMPVGTSPPLIIKYSASSVPLVQLGLSSPTMSEQDVLDAATTSLRPQLITIPGVAIPFPYGGKVSQINVDLDTQALQAKGLSAADVVNAINVQNLVLPTGTIKMGETEQSVALNGSFDSIAALNELPVRTRNGATIRLAEVGHVRDGFAPQTNVVRLDGQRGALLTLLKNGGTSTLDIVAGMRALLPAAAQTLPQDFQIKPLFDQTVFVKAAIRGVVIEGVIAACLAAAMILVFLGNWRSTLLIAISIPLSVLASILLLYAVGETLNIMTLGGLALAVGILVDDATVTVENIERHLRTGTDLRQALRAGASEIAVPAFVSTACICIVFVPMFFLEGVTRFLFVPLALAVVFAMAASYVLSRTLVPTLMLLFMARSHARRQAGAAPDAGRLQRLCQPFTLAFERMRRAYLLLLTRLLVRRRRFGALFFGFAVLSLGLYPLLGSDFFPAVDSGQMRLHMRMPSGTRIEETVRAADRVESAVRELITARQLDTIIDNIGVANSGINLSYNNAGTIGPIDAEILISLKPGHAPTALHLARLRHELGGRFPGIEFFFQPADMVSQVLNFGVPAAIDIQFSGKDLDASLRLAHRLQQAVRAIPGTVDTHIHQRRDQPTLRLAMDRTRLQQMDVDPASVAQNLLVTLSGSFQTAPAYWLNPRNGVVNNIVVQTPQHEIDSVDSLMRIPVRQRSADAVQLMGNLVTASPDRAQAVVSRYNLKPVIDVYVGVAGRDLGAVAADVERQIAAIAPQLPRGAQVTLRGQVQTMRAAYRSLLTGLAMSIVVVYLLVVVSFQSWLDALVIVAALPAALAGIAWTLLLTGNSLSVPALIGAILTVGVATANSILVVSFARQRMEQGSGALEAALAAGATRMRPVLMTASAMIIGMVPMALGVGEAAEQNAPLGLAAIGGLLFATVSTLVFVPVVFAGVQRWRARRAPRAAHRKLSHA